MSNPKKPRAGCLYCGKEQYRSYYKYCSNKCQLEYQYEEYIAKWKKGEVVGLRSTGIVSTHIKKYLRIKYNNKCCVCGWSKTNKITNKVPLVADHIDGNWKNNNENNLRLICPNCDSLTSTYAALNKGRGRPDRKKRKRTEEAREYLSSLPK